MTSHYLPGFGPAQAPAPAPAAPPAAPPSLPIIEPTASSAWSSLRAIAGYVPGVAILALAGWLLATGYCPCPGPVPTPKPAPAPQAARPIRGFAA